MSLLLPDILNPTHRANSPVLVVRYSLAHSPFPILRQLIRNSLETHSTFLVCIDHPPAAFLGGVKQHDNLHVLNWTAQVPGYSNASVDPYQNLLKVVQECPTPGPLTVFIDSAETLSSDLGSVAKTCALLQTLLRVVKSRPKQSQLILPICQPSALLPMLSSVFTSSLTQLGVIPPLLLAHIASSYLTLPPTAAQPSPRFWSLFIPMCERLEAEKLVFEAGEGPGTESECVVDVLIRGTPDGAKRSRGTVRELEGWRAGQACLLEDLPTLKGLWTQKQPVDTFASNKDPTQNLSFNLSLTPSQHKARSEVPLPYAHQGEAPYHAPPGEILYDPDSGDDIDFEDPDEDLDL